MATKLVVDCSTGITTEVELTAEEVAQREADALAWAEAEEARVAAEAAKASAKASAESKLKALGLTDAEVSALIG
jgi:membrane protein involved in colicin uptake